MECNRDEALRAKEIAERKFNEKDYIGAKKFVLKAQNLYPHLDCLPQMSTTLDIYISSQKRISTGEVDWYNLLGVSPSADEETMKKQYRKLALALHPDKNKSLGADGAFRLVSEAWSLLSDKDKRLSYNKNLNQNETSFHQQSSKASSSAQPNANGFHAKTQKKNTWTWQATTPPPPPSTKKQTTFAGGTTANSGKSSSKKPDTFWTICNECKTQYEYLRAYLNHSLLCPNCHKPFLAEERAPPPNITKPANQPNRRKQQNPKNHTVNSKASSKPKSSGVESNVGGYVNGSGEIPTGNGARAATESDRNHIHKRAPEGGTPPEVDQLFKKRKLDETYMNLSGNEKPGSVETERIYSFPGFGYASKESSPMENHGILVGKARREISKVLQEWSSREAKASNGKKHNNVDSSLRSNSEKPSMDPVSGDEGTESAPSPELMAINVPDPDFHNFDSVRTETSFEDDQVWAAYDENDGMPRYYARIQKMMSLEPFKMKISWLNSRSTSEFGSLDWVGSGFLKTCGEFRIGKHEISRALNAFSHRVKWTKGSRGTICILPSKGDVWALYRNWSQDWDQHTSQEVIRKYDMVEVVDDYDEERGISVVPLVKVDGFKTVFANCSSTEVKRIPKEEMFRFSHQVPHHLLTGEEAENAPKGCLELDPAATPLELLQVVSNSKG